MRSRSSSLVLLAFLGVSEPVLAQSLVPAASPSAKYIYTFSGNIQFQFGATGLVGPGSYSYQVSTSDSFFYLPFPSADTQPAAGFAYLTLTSTGEWDLTLSGSHTCSLAAVVDKWALTPSAAQLPTLGTNIVYNTVTHVSTPDTCPFPSPTTTTIFPGSANLVISAVNAPPPATPAPATLLLAVAGLGAVGLMARKSRTA